MKNHNCYDDDFCHKETHGLMTEVYQGQLYLLLMRKSVEIYEAVCKFCPFCGYSVEKSHD